MSLAAGERIGRYEVLAPLGAGAMGEVYYARDPELDRPVAIKVLTTSRATGLQLERFQREARAVARITHPHICTVYDVGQLDGVPFLVMELLEGETLAARLEHGPLPLDRALGFAGQIAGALDAAHRKGVIHRDLKPSNVMLTAGGVKLLDFGLAKLKDIEGESALAGSTESLLLTEHGTVLGTVPYMAPEQIAEIRVALGDDAAHPRFVRTIQRFGYAFRDSTPEHTVRRKVIHRKDARFRLAWIGGGLGLMDGEYVLGRDPELEVFLDSPDVSRRHARITIAGDEVTIEDLDSKNGTFVSDRKLQAATVLTDGDIIRLGSFELTFTAIRSLGSTKSVPARGQ